MINTVTLMPYVILSPRSTPTTFRSIQLIKDFTHLQRGGLYAIDIETNGISPFRKDAKILCIALAGKDGVYVLDTREYSRAQLRSLCVPLKHCRLIAHNLLFDSLWLEVLTHLQLNYVACTLVLFKLCANEGWDGQSWSLDTANTQVLNVTVNNKAVLDQLLALHRLPKTRMWELAYCAPTEFFTYCGNDAEACYELYHELHNQFDAKFGKGALAYWSDLWLNEIELIREQQIRGLQIDRNCVSQYHKQLLSDIQQLRDKFLSHQATQDVALMLRNQALAELKDKEPAQKNLLDEHYNREPAKYTKSGVISKSWERWHTKLLELQQQSLPYNKSWLSWYSRYQQIAESPLTEWFNINSLDHLKLLFFDRLGFSSIKSTPKGEPAIDNKALRFFGELGAILLQYKDLFKEEGYVRSLLESINEHDILHPGFKIFGTITGRLSAGGF